MVLYGYMIEEKYNQAFIKAKIQKAQRGTLLEHGHKVESVNRLPPGQTITKGWPILDLGVRPSLELQNWKLEIGGLVENPVIFSWEDFLKLPQSAVTDDMHCVTAWSKFDNVWEGVAFMDILEIVKPMAQAHFVVQYGYDGYTTNAPLEDFLKDNVLIATRHDGEYLTPEHGGPARMIIPSLYAWKGSKFIKKIDFFEKDSPGFWEVRGYNSHGDPWKEERYS